VNRIVQRLALILCLLPTAAPLYAQQASDDPISTQTQVQESFAPVPCKEKERLPAVRALFEKMGAAPGDIAVEKYRGADNLVVTMKGAGPGKIVIGAHYDFIDDGCGAIDNWTGIVAMAHVYRTVRQFGIHKTILFVAFGNEEKGLFGSRGMVKAIAKEDLPNYCAMINIDSFGMALPFVLRNISSNKLMALVEERAAVLKVPVNKVTILNAGSDSEAFLERGIPAVTLSGLGLEWEAVLHSKKDQVAAVNHTSVYLGYRLALATWASVDAAPCGTYSESKSAPSK
jgi:Zn-dependent M28 family amino/carboxypeptidase